MPRNIDRSLWVLLPVGEHQSGWVEKRNRNYVGRFRTYWRLPDGKQSEYKERIDLGPVSQGKKAAEQQLAVEIQRFYETRLSQFNPMLPSPDKATFAWLLDRVWELRQTQWAPNTVSANKMYFDTLRNKFGHMPIQHFGTAAMQDYMQGWLNMLGAEGRGRDYVSHLLTYLRAALNEAVKHKLLHYNYAKDVRRPKTKPRDERVLCDDEVAAILHYFLSEGRRKDALILTILYLCALRPGELFALKWDDWDERHPHELRIDQTYSRGNLGPTKTLGSKATVYLPKHVQAELAEWKHWCGDTRSDAYMFPANKGRAMRMENWRKRVLQPAAKAVGIEAVNFPMLRRSFSTMMVDNEASPKDIQRQMRHSRVDMSMYYAKAIPKSVAEEVEKLATKLLERECPQTPPTAPKTSYSNSLKGNGGRSQARTADLLLVRQAL